MNVPSDIEIARAAKLLPISEVAARIGLEDDDLIPFGKTKAKVHLDTLKRISSNPRGKYIDVTAITPTPLGEGKTTTTVGLTQGLGAIGKNAIACIRQPSMGPTFGIKGGAAGGGYSQVVPMDEFNLHLTGDVHAITVAHNLVAAAIDARWFHETRLSDDALAKVGLERLGIDVFNLQWNRVLDINDRALRNVIVGLGGRDEGRPRETGFDIAVASELMAILALVDGADYASALRNLRERVARVVFGTVQGGQAPDPGRSRGGRGGDGSHEGNPPSQHHADPRGPARLRPCRTVRQHRPRQLVDPGRPHRPSSRRLRDHRVGIRGRHGHGEVHGHQVPDVGPPPRRGGPGGDGAGTEDPWWRSQGGAGPSPRQGLHRREPLSAAGGHSRT